ncbi:MAG TPA: hypothetical protein VHO25_18825 [Polyangiaceae bacterium]|nr:hypothetical protein [Polyangiaceae bacterium]
MPDPSKPRSQFSEIGVTGLVQYAGYVREELLSELTGPRWIKNVQQIQNDPVAAAGFFAIDKLTRQVTWEVVSPSDANEDEERAQFIRECLDDMCSPWKETISEIHSYLPWGYSWHELVYKRRNGESRDPDLSSKFTDGRIGWAKWPIRSQESLDHWQFGPNGQIEGMWQRAAPTYQTALIPAEKSLHFRTTSHKNNPEGRSLCRPIFRPWYFKQNIENYEAIGIEREFNGIPVMRVPSEIMAEDASGDQVALFRMCKQIVTTAKANEMAGFVYPSDVYDGTSALKYEFALVSANGTNRIDARKVIQAKNLEILLTLLLDFLLMGHEKVGSFALASSKTDVFGYALGAFLDSDCEIINRHAIPRLLRLNGMPTENPPRLTHGDIESLDLMEVANFLNTMATAGYQLTNEQLAYVLKQTGLPVPEDPEEMRKQQPDKAAPLPEEGGNDE